MTESEELVSHIKRYMFGWATPLRDGDLVMHEKPDGMWVRYEDLISVVKNILKEDRDQRHWGCPPGTPYL
jgi:hypothetical protein